MKAVMAMMKPRVLLAITAFVGGMLPMPVFAQSPIEVQDPGISTFLQDVFDVVAPILVTLIILYILYGAFLFATGNAERREQGKESLLYGAIGLVIIASLLGLISLVLDSVSVTGSDVNIENSVGGFNNI